MFVCKFLILQEQGPIYVYLYKICSILVIYIYIYIVIYKHTI